jgi:hypothetical protein
MVLLDNPDYPKARAERLPKMLGHDIFCLSFHIISLSFYAFEDHQDPTITMSYDHHVCERYEPNETTMV